MAIADVCNEAAHDLNRLHRTSIILRILFSKRITQSDEIEQLLISPALESYFQQATLLHKTSSTGNQSEGECESEEG